MKLERTDWLLLIVLLLVAALGALWTGMAPDADVEHDVPPSSFETGRGGARAVYRVFEKLGADVGQVRRPTARAALQDYDGLVLLEPSERVTEEEARELLRWVADGGRLLLVPGRGDFAGWFVSEDVPRNLFTDEDARAFTPSHADPNEPLLAGVQKLATRPVIRFAEPFLAEDGPLAGAKASGVFEDDRGVMAVRIDHGTGRILVLGDSFPLRNLAVGAADNPVFLGNLYGELSAGVPQPRIGFDEYHHGFIRRDAQGTAMLKLVFGGGRAAGMAQLALAALAAALLFGVRFGVPRDVVVRRRRRHGEFIDAAAELLDSGGAIEPVARTLYRDARQKLGGRMALGREDDLELADRVKQQCGVDVAPALYKLGGRSGPLDRASLLGAVRTIDEARERLEHGN